MRLLLSLALLSLCSLSGCGSATAPVPATSAQTDKGPVLVDSKGMTLYTFERDKNGQSLCNGNCLQKWPALLASTGAQPSGDWTLISRRDGALQWAYKGQPLYTWYQDSKPGETTGDNEGDVWHLARP
jgi:predicted lipoprotein with Yx(FWY)xxD motif